MADPFSTACAVASLADIVFRTCTKLYEVLSGLQDVPTEIEDLSNSLLTWKSVSQAVRDISARYEVSPFASEDHLVLSGVYASLKSCEAAFASIDVLVKRYQSGLSSKPARFVKDVKWIFDGRKIQSAQQNLEKSKSALTTALSAISSQNDIAVRAQTQAIHQDAQKQHQDAQKQRQELSNQCQNLAQELSAQEARLGWQVDDVKTMVEGSTAEIIDVVQHCVLYGAAATHALIEANGKLIGKRMNTFEQKMAQQMSNHNLQLRRTIQNEVKKMNTRLGSLTITENEATGDYSILAGENLHEIMLPLTMMQPELFSFISELVESRRVEVSGETLQDIEEKLEDLLASCHSASAADFRRHKKADRRSRVAGSTRASELLSRNQGNSSHFHWMRSSFLLRSGVWKKKLPHGILQVRIFPLKGRNRAEDSHSLNAYFLTFTFTPHSWEVTKCVNISLLSGIQAIKSPKEFHHIRSFNILKRDHRIREIIGQDNVEELQKALSAKAITPWDLLDVFLVRDDGGADSYSILHHAAYHTSTKCFRVLLNQGAPVNDVRNRNFSILSAVWKRSFAEENALDLTIMSETALGHGADFDDWIDSQNDYATPLHAIAATGNFRPSDLAKTIRHLLNKGYFIDTKDHRGWTPFLFFVFESTPSDASIDAWIQSGADVNAHDFRGRNAFHLLADGLQFNFRDYNKHWKRLYNIVRDTKTIIQDLIRGGCDPNHQDSDGRTPSVYMRHFFTDQLFHVWISALQEERQVVPNIDFDREYESLSCPFLGNCWIHEVGRDYSNYVKYPADEQNYKDRFHHVWCLHHGRRLREVDDGLELRVIYRCHFSCGICFPEGQWPRDRGAVYIIPDVLGNDIKMVLNDEQVLPYHDCREEEDETRILELYDEKERDNTKNQEVYDEEPDSDEAGTMEADIGESGRGTETEDSDASSDGGVPLI